MLPTAFECDDEPPPLKRTAWTAERAMRAICEMAGKSKALPPRRKRMSGGARLQSGRHWLKTFTGKRVVSSYARWFGVDLMCAAKDLQTLGMHLAPEYLQALRRTAAGRSRDRRDDARDAKAVDVEPISNQDFAYIAGYTAAGVPFGVTWEEMEGLAGHHGPFTGHDFEEGDFDF